MRIDKFSSRAMVRRADSIGGSDAGLTLVELLVVLGILALFAGIAVPQVLKYLGKARVETVKTQVNALSSAVELYHLDVGAYPRQQDGLAALIKKPAQVAVWNGPYLKHEGGLIDAWGKPYRYTLPGKKGEFDIYSLGRDGKNGGTGEDADIGNWR